MIRTPDGTTYRVYVMHACKGAAPYFFMALDDDHAKDLAQLNLTYCNETTVREATDDEYELFMG